MICCVEIRPSIDRTVPERDRLSIRQERRPDLRAGPVRADQNRCSRGRAIRKVGRRPEGRGLDTRALLAKRHLILETTQKNLTQCRPVGPAWQVPALGPCCRESEPENLPQLSPRNPKQ